MKNKRNKKLLASFLFALGLSTNQVNVLAKNGQIRDTLKDLIWCNSAKNAERAELEKIASKIDELVTTFNKNEKNRDYKSEDEDNVRSYISQYATIYTDLKKELVKIFSRRTKDKDKIYSDLALSIQGDKYLSKLLDDKNAQEAQYDANNMLEFFKNANNLDFGTWSVWKRVRPSLNKLLNLLNKRGLQKILLENNEGLQKILRGNNEERKAILRENNDEVKNFLGDNIQHEKLENTGEHKNKAELKNFLGDNGQHGKLAADTWAHNNAKASIYEDGHLVVEISNCGQKTLGPLLDNNDLRSKVQSVSFTGDVSKIKILHGTFAGFNNLKSIEIPDSIETIGYEAFMGCTNLESVKFLGNSLKKIDGWAFNNCTNLKSIEIPDSIETIGMGAFNGCTNLSNVTILGNSLTEIPDFAFNQCTNLESIEIPSSVEKFGALAFNDCKKLSYVKIPEKFKMEVLSIFPRGSEIEFDFDYNI